MLILYQFWTHFLIRNFNTRMFLEFRHLAEDDHAAGFMPGMDSLLKYYAAALMHRTTIKEVVMKSLLELVDKELERRDTKEVERDTKALKLLRSAWKSGMLEAGTKQRVREMAEDGLLELLDS